MTEQKRLSPFVRGLLIYALVLLLLLGGALLVFRDFLQQYELSRPIRAIEEYQRSLAEDGPGDACRAALQPLDRSLESEEEALAWLSGLLENARLKEDVSQGSDEQKVYRILVEGGECGRITLRPGAPGRYGFVRWHPAEEEFDFTPWFHTLSITVPEEYRVRYGAQTLGKAHVVKSGLQYSALQECYELLDDLPTMVAYETGPLIGDGELEAFDRHGQRIAPEDLEEDRYLDNCNAQQKARMKDFAEIFVPTYVRFTVSVSDYDVLREMILKNSPLDLRLSKAVGEGWWSVTSYCKLLSTDIRHCVDLGENRWLLDLAYVTETKAYSDPVTAEYCQRLVLFEEDGQLRAGLLFNY